MNKRTNAACLLVINLLCGSVAQANAVANGQRSAGAKSTQTQQGPNSPDQMLKLGFFYYNNDDISDKAAQQFRALIAKYPKSSEAETAQYYLGSYYQRKYYVQMTNYRKDDKAALDMAIREYRGYTDRYYKGGSHQWLGDAFFNLALVYLQRGDSRNAEFELSKMSGASSVDNSVYIYQVVYSQGYDDVIDGKVTTKRLADYTSSLIKDSRKSFKQITAAIKDWFKAGTKG